METDLTAETRRAQSSRAATKRDRIMARQNHDEGQLPCKFSRRISLEGMDSQIPNATGVGTTKSPLGGQRLSEPQHVESEGSVISIHNAIRFWTRCGSESRGPYSVPPPSFVVQIPPFLLP